METSTARVTTTDPQRVIKRLCKHWGHKFPVHLHDEGGDIELSLGRCALKSGEGVLDVTLQAESADDLQRLQTVVADHLQRMAGDAEMRFDWQP